MAEELASTAHRHIMPAAVVVVVILQQLALMALVAWVAVVLDQLVLLILVAVDQAVKTVELLLLHKVTTAVQVLLLSDMLLMKQAELILAVSEMMFQSAWVIPMRLV